MNRTSTRLLLLAILLLAFALRVTNLGAQELRGDEAFGYFFTQQGYRAIIDQTVALDEPHPVASYFVQKPWLGIAGDSEYALRFVGVFFGVLAVALLGRLAHRLRMAAPALLVASLLLAISPYAIWHSQDARMYSMSLALTIALVWLAIEALSRRRWQWIVAYIAVTLLALHTHYFAGYVLIALTIFVLGRALVSAPARRAVVDWILWNIIAFVLYMPWLAMAGSILAGYGGNGDSPTLFDALLRAFSVFAVGETVPVDQRVWWAAIAAAILLLGTIRLWMGGSNNRRTLWLLLCYLFVPLLLTWYSAQSRPIFNERYLVTAAPAFFLLAGATLQRPPRVKWLDWLAAGLLVVLVAGMGLSLWRYNNDPAYSKSRGWRELAARVANLPTGFNTGEVRFAQNYPEPTLWYYLDADPHLTLPPAALDANRAAREVDALADEGIRRVILIQQDSPTWDDFTRGGEAHGVAATTLEDAFDQSATIEQGNFTLAIFDRPAAVAPLNVRFAENYDLLGRALAPETLAPGNVLAVMLKWHALPALPDAAHKITLQLLGPDGAIVAQQDEPLALDDAASAGEEPLTTYGILLPDVLAAGDYRLIMAIYDPNVAGLPRLSVNAGGDAIELATWTIQ